MGKTLGYGEITVANMTEPFTVMLTNEAQQFATDSNRKVTSAQSYYTDIIVIRGSQERTDYTIGNITSGSGITVSKSSKRVTFSVSAGTTIGADTGVVEIPITLDGQTVKKQFSWSCGKQGPQGVKGENGNKGKSVQSVIEYYLATSASSGVTSSTSGWSIDPTTQKLTAEKKYLWNCKQTVYDDGTRGSITSPVICGTYGETGKNALQSNRTYTGTYTTVGETAYASTSSFNRIPIVGDIYSCLDGSSNTGTWQVTAISGTNVTVKLLGYIKSKDEDGKNGADGDSFAWNMLSETNCGKKHWGTESSGGKYSVEDFITEDNIDAVKLICTEAISTSNWSYVSFKDIKMLKQLKPSTKYTLSYDIKANRSGAISHSICKGDVSNFCTNTVVVNNIIGNETWQHISVVLTTNDLKTTPTNEILYLGRNALSKVGYSIIKNLKLVEGDIDTPWSPSQSDIEGKGVVETVQYYLATSQASGVTSSTSGWSTDITTQKLTADKKYLWNCYQTKYSDGTSEPISTPKVIGVYGDKGTSTKIIRTGYKYTQNNIDTFSASGYSRTWGTADATTGLKVGDNVLLRVKNTTKGSDCLIFASITAIPSNYSLTCTSYGLIDNGADGQDGEDGAGFHWNLLKYSGDLSKQVLGGAGTYTATVESIEDKTTPSGQAEKITYTVQGTGGKFIQTGKYIKEGDIKQGKTYTVSVWCKCSSIKSTGVINAEFLDNKTYVNPTLSTEWQQYVVTGVANKDVTSTSSASAISFCYSDNMSVGDIFYISSPKVEEGDKASPWCTTYEETLAKNLSITPSSQYFKSTDGGKTFAPNTITIKPTIQGEINFGKWQYSIDGGVSFTDVVSGQKGLTISNNVLAVSKDSSLYSDAVTMITFRAVADDSSFYDTCSIAKIYDVSDIGDGRNLLWNSNFAKTDEAITGTTNSWGLHTRGTNLVASIDTSTKHNGFNTLKTVSAANGDKNSSNDLEWFAWGISERTSDNLHSKNQNYTLSFYAKASVTTDFIVRWGYDAYGADTTRTLTTNWQKYEIKLHQATSAYSITIIFKLLTAGTVWFSEFKLEKGSSATGYSTAPEDLQTAILSTKSEISDVSLKVDNNKQAIEQRVEKTTYEQDLKLVKGDISKANEGLNKWRYEIYPKSLFASEYQGKSTMDVFAKNTNLTPSQSVLINDTDLSIAWNYDNNYIGYALTFAKFSAAKSVAITFAHDDGAHIYLNGKLIGGSDAYSQTGESLTLGFVKGWNCIEVIVNEGASTEGFKLGTTISAISECQLMNCYYGTPVARQSHITNQLVENTTNIKGISTKVSKVTSVIGENGENFTSFKNDYSDFKQTMNGFKTTVGQTYVTKDDFNGLEIGGRNLLLYSQTIRAHKDYYGVGWLTDEVETFNGCPVWSVKNQWGRLTWLFKSHVIDRGLVKVGDTLTYSLYAKTNNASGKSINCSYRFKGNTNAYWFNGSAFNVGTNWTRYSVTFTITKDMLATDTYMTEIGFEETASMSGDDKVYYACPKLERGTKATDYTPALEDNEINGQNLVSNLPSNWEQGSINYTANLAYGSLKSTLVPRLRTKDVFPVSGNITISAGTSTNSSKEELNFYYVLFDINKKSISHGDTWQSLTSPKIINCGDAKYMAIILRWGSGSTAITPSDISQICLKIERGTSATPFTLAPEDVNGKIVNVETIANQTAKKFEWIVKGGDKSSSMVLTDDFLNIVANNINLTGKVTFSWLNNETQKKITDANTWVTNNGSSTTSLNSMVKKWTDGAVSDTTQINGGWIKANTITASKIAVGDFTNYADINESNTYGFTVEKTADGVWFSKDGSKLGRDNYISKMYSCEPGQTFYVEYDISNTIKDSTEYKAAGTMLFGCDGTQTVKWYQRRGAVVGTAAGTVTHMSQQLTMPSGTRFFYVVLQIEGHPPFTGTLKIRNLSVRKAVTGAVIVDGSITADKIATDAIKSRNYISSGGTQGSFLNLSDGSFTSPNLSWDANGNLIAKNANLSGQITATKGSIGGWSVDNYSIYTTYDADQNIFGSGISGTKGKYVLWAGETNNAIGANRSSDTPTDASLVIYNNGGLEVRKTMVGNDKKNHLYTTILQSGQINLKMDDNYIGTITATDTISSNSTVTMSHVSMAAKKGYGWSILHTDDSGNLISDIQRDPGDTKIKIRSPITVSSTDITKYNAIETTGDVVVNGKIHANYGPNRIQFNPDNNGSIELYGGMPFIDFHFACSNADYTSRIISQHDWDCLTFTGSILLGGTIYNSSGGHYTWDGKDDAYISCGNYSGGNNIYYYANYHAFYVNNDSGSGMMYINTNGVTSRVGFTKTSDERIKKNFESFDDNIIDAYMNIEPVKYQLKQSSNDNYHFGFKAQHVDKVFSDYGDIYNESFDICTSRPIDPDKAKELYGVDGMVEEYGLRYDELIAPTTYMVQHIYKELESTKGELAKVKQEKADLETRLQAIEAKLGL